VPHIPVPDNFPGIRGLMAFRPETAKVLNELVDILLRGPHTLDPGERELIATYVSSRNDCSYCQTIHGAIAACDLGGNEALVAAVKRDFRSAPISNKLKALLEIADQVRQSGKRVTAELIAQARHQGATDQEIHDAVLIAASFCMFNRYVDGLAAITPEDPEFYRQRASHIVQNGYSSVNRDLQSRSRD
jgi:uncharacterized peroxidase-related enzyme